MGALVFAVPNRAIGDEGLPRWLTNYLTVCAQAQGPTAARYTNVSGLEYDHCPSPMLESAEIPSLESQSGT